MEDVTSPIGRQPDLSSGTRKPAVLFVDDEPRVLDGIRRSLRARRHDWDMQFRTDGAAAIEHLASAPCDVVVSDMRMPGMDGAQLLKQVSLRHPAAARVVLSGHSEQEAGLRASVVGHRFVSKPCDGEALTGLLDQLTQVGGERGAHLRSAAGAVHCLPILPRQLERVTRTLAVPDVGLPEVVESVTNSIGLAAKLLQLANSNFFCSGNRVTSLPYAVTALGMPTVQALLAADQTHWAVPAGAGPEEQQELEALWRHSVAAAKLVRQLASPANAPYSEAAALLQDAGRLALLSARTGDERTPSAAAADTPHANDVGAHLLQLWGLPRPIVVAVADRYAERDPEPYGLGVSTALRTAHLLLQDTSCADPHDGMHEEELAALLRHPQLTADDTDWRARAELVSQQTEKALA